jgi:hypothetical protein
MVAGAAQMLGGPGAEHAGTNYRDALPARSLRADDRRGRNGNTARPGEERAAC